MTESDYRKFIDVNCDRKFFIQSYLNKMGLDCPVISIEGKNHLYVKFPVSQYDPSFKIKTVIAHYDVFPGSPGANDNSSSVVAMLDWAERLVNRKTFHNIRMIFTDGEELGSEGVAFQGAFALAKTFTRLGITKDDVFVFDCMGRGTVPVLCENNLKAQVPANFRNQMSLLESKVERILLTASRNKWLRLPCNYSDNASFLANGIPAVAITMLPSSEAELYMRNGEIPYTWKLFHTGQDNYESLNPESFEITARILDNLADLRSLA